jgi:hypothetical protein
MARIYATVTDLIAFTGDPAPDNAAMLLADAHRFLDANVFSSCLYDVDATTGMPTNTVVLAALRDAVCAQVQWWDELGDSIGAAGAGWGSVQIGRMQLARSVTNVSGAASPAREVAPKVGDVLGSSDLTPEIFRLGLVESR